MLQQKIALTLMLTLKPNPVLRKRESLLNGVSKPVAKKKMMIKEKNRMNKEERREKRNFTRTQTEMKLTSYRNALKTLGYSRPFQ
jgi:Holliday junction resolvasome RuvABC DNA-binding subunit